MSRTEPITSLTKQVGRTIMANVSRGHFALPVSQLLSLVGLALEIVSCENVSVLRCRGRLTYGSETNELVRTARQVLETTKEIVLQMAEVTQIDSGGVGALGSVLISARNRDAEVKLATLHPRVAEVLRITGLELLFDIRTSESEAIAAFSSQRPQPR